MKRLGIIANCGKPHAGEVLEHLAKHAREFSLSLFADRDTAGLLEGCEIVDPEGMFGHVDGVMALGGDGTMLKVARLLAGRDIPVIGVNIGGLGFLTSVSQEKLGKAVECLAGDDYTIANRSTAESVVFGKKGELASFRALNDVVIRSSCPRVITLEVRVDGDAVTSYVCDGLVVSTPTGSTGHSLSAGGPIITPGAAAFVVSLVCPHTLSSRPLVVPDSAVVSIGVAGSDGAFLSADGQVGCSVECGQRVEVKRSEMGVRFIHLPGHSYFDVLRKKLGWSGSSKRESP